MIAKVEQLCKKVTQLEVTIGSSYRDSYQLAQYEIHQKYHFLALRSMKLNFAWKEILAKFKKFKVLAPTTPPEEILPLVQSMSRMIHKKVREKMTLILLRNLS